jgi:two-component system chemotaxis response regulator CheB
MIKILIADDSPKARKAFSDLFKDSPEIEVVGCARNAREAVDFTLRLKPDLVMVDLALPENGYQVIEEIMAGAPTPVLVLAAAVEAAEVDRAFNCIKRGALDVMEKPAINSLEAAEDFARRLIEKVKLLAGIRVIRRPRRKPCCRAAADLEPAGPPARVLAIGASTGGPKGVMSVLKTLPADFQAAVFVVQHIAEGFTDGFASWLDAECAIPVRVAVDGARYVPGEAVVARGGSHMTVADGRIKLTDDAPVNCCRPSIDVFFNSLAQEHGGRVVGLLLSGMGKDGAQGLLNIKTHGGTTLVQDKVSCAVFGMPKAAIDLQAVNEVLPLDCIPAALSKLFAR